MADRNSDSWQINRGRTLKDQDGMWMIQTLDEGWLLHIRLVTNGYRTVMDQVHIEPSQTTKLHGLRGALEIPTDPTAEPTWIRVPLHHARRDATSRLNQVLNDHRHAQERRYAAATKGQVDPNTTERRNQVDTVIAMDAEFKGFTTSGTRVEIAPSGDRQLRLALIAVAYEHACNQHPTHPRLQVYEWLKQLHLHYASTSIGPLIHEARNQGMLARGTPRRAAGKATRKAHNLIRHAGIDLPWTKEE